MDLHVNGARHRTDADPKRSLLSVLRDDLDLTGSKYGCGEGQCGACTVLVDGRPTRSCLLPVGTCKGVRIRTIEGLATNGDLHPVQQAFVDAGAMQCGYCTPGMIMSAIGLLERDADPGEREIAEHMQGNICRCGTYARIITAIRKVAGKGGGR